VVDPTKGDSSIFVALTKADQKSPDRFTLQQQLSSLPAYKPHDASENSNSENDKE